MKTKSFLLLFLISKGEIKGSLLCPLDSLLTLERGRE